MESEYMSKKSSKFRIGAILFLIAVLLAFTMLFLKSYIDYEVRRPCNNMKEIAKDTEKIQHIRSRIEPFYGSEELLDSIGKARYIDKSFNPQLFSKIDIDWDYIGLPEYLVHMHFYGEMYGESSAKGVRVVYGRNSFSFDLGNDILEDEVSVFCEVE